MRHLTFALICVLLLSGCATLFSGTDEDITFNSTPSGAKVIIEGIVVGTTPTTVSVDRPGLEEMDVTIRLDGYDDFTFELDKEFNTTAIWNLFVWPGFLVDALTGALYKYDKTEYTADLRDRTVALDLHALPRGDQGQYLVPDTGETVVVVEKETGLRIVFK